MICVLSMRDFEEMDDILKMPIAITRIYQPYLGSDNPYISARAKKDWYLATKDKMLGEFCKDIVEILT